MNLIHNFLSGLVDIVYPKICHVCKEKIKGSSMGGFVCTECWSRIKLNTPPFCSSCGRSMAGKKFVNTACANCIENPAHFDRAFSPCSYEGVIQELIRAFKYKDKDYLGAILTKPMVNFIKEFHFPIELMDLIIPVPLYKSKLREREFNQALILSQYLSAEFGKNTAEGILIRHKNTKTQTELSGKERFLNVKESFSVTQENAVKGKNILLVDDILTTGATCSEAALKLKQAGANIVYVLTLAN